MPPKSNPTAPKARSSASQRRSRRRVVDLSTAVSMAEAGNDTELLNIRPMHTINPQRPRTRQAGYDGTSETLFVRFRDGSPASPSASWEYYEVPQNIWRNFIRNQSPGRYINRVLNHYPNGPGVGW